MTFHAYIYTIINLETGVTVSALEEDGLGRIR